MSGLDIAELPLRRALHVLLHLRFANVPDKDQGRVQFELDQPHWSDPKPDTATDPNADLFADPADAAAFLAAQRGGIGGME